MAEPSFFEVAFEEAQNLLQTEADGFAAVLQNIAGFDIISSAGDAISIFEGAGAALLAEFYIGNQRRKMQYLPEEVTIHDEVRKIYLAGMERERAAEKKEQKRRK